MPRRREGYPLQYSGLENSMDCIVHLGRKELDTTKRLSLSDIKPQSSHSVGVYLHLLPVASLPSPGMNWRPTWSQGYFKGTTTLCSPSRITLQGCWAERCTRNGKNTKPTGYHHSVSVFMSAASLDIAWPLMPAGRQAPNSDSNLLSWPLNWVPQHCPLPLALSPKLSFPAPMINSSSFPQQMPN